MKHIYLIAAIAVTFAASCSSGGNAHDKKQFPAPGTVVAEASMPIAEDKLNHTVFTVKVIADSEVTSGVYAVDADFGPNYANGKFTMPKGIEDAKPAIKQGSEPYTYIIGFRLDKDTTFYEYFEVQSSKATTKMRYTKAYTF